MHPALQIAEIVELICNESADFDGDRDLKTLGALARTATTFTHSALNGLWERQNGLINILECLPADLWDVGRGLLDDGSLFHLLCPVKQTDLERLLVHSARVKILEFAREDVTPRISGLLHQIQPFLPQSSLFPNLRSIIFERARERGLLSPHLGLFIPNTVTRIWMNLEDIGNWPLLPLLPPLNSSFTSVRLIMDRDPNNMERSFISTFVWALDQVTDLEVPALDPTALKHVASLVALKSLSINRAGAGDLSPGLLRPLGFYLRMQHYDYFHYPDNRGFYGHTISLLFCFSSMQNLDLCAPGRFQLEDAFPELWLLSLTTSDGVHYTPHVTLDGFAIHCPYLASLSIAFDATVIPPAIDFTTSNAFYPKLTKLDVLDSRISSPSDVARFLPGIFPLLARLACNHEPMRGVLTAEDCENWDQVKSMLDARRRCREERLRAAAPSMRV
ncbi:hypothetical protein C8J57DRAFT_1470606 [Mycena rebaudengoi]|nr:hypothetical protein C8J57DRAFT_1470606 [Mycena rebaudengoi]